MVPLVTVKGQRLPSPVHIGVGKGPLTQLVFHSTPPTNSSVHILKILHMETSVCLLCYRFASDSYLHTSLSVSGWLKGDVLHNGATFISLLERRRLDDC